MTRLPRPTRRTQLRLTRGMQFVLLGLVVYGLVTHQPKAIVNGGVAVCVTVLPALLERNYRIPLDPWLGLWVTLAVFLHTLGSAGLYDAIPWWDHVTHATSASLVAAVGYTVARAVDLHSDDVDVPGRFMFVYIFVVVLAFAVVWELLEFGLDGISTATGWTMPLAQHGLADTVHDLMFNALGAAVVAVFGQTWLSGLVETMQERVASGG